MKRIVSLVAVVSLLVNCAIFTKPHREYRVKGPIVISERVGEVIDVQEREYFGLFPRIYVHPLSYPFESAMFYGLEGGGYEVRIATGQGTVVSVNRGQNAVMVLAYYIDNYEDIVTSRSEFEEKWDIAAYDDLSQPITKDEIRRARKPLYGVALAVPGGIVLGYGCILGCLGGILSAGFGDETEDVVGEVLPLIGIGGLVTAAGAFGGYMLDVAAARDAVKKSRKPRMLE